MSPGSDKFFGPGAGGMPRLKVTIVRGEKQRPAQPAKIIFHGDGPANGGVG
jgi:hypothetical protein